MPARNIGGALLTDFAGSHVAKTNLIEIRKPDGSGIYLTTHDKNLVIDTGTGAGSQTYVPHFVVEWPSVSFELGAVPDKAALHVRLDAAIFQHRDFVLNQFNGAVVFHSICNWRDVSHGAVIYGRYDIENTTLEAGVLKFELSGIEHRLDLPVSRILTASCPFHIGDVKCGYDFGVLQWTTATVYATSIARDWSQKVVVRPSVQNGFWYEATVGGTSGGPEPTWPVVLGGTVADNGITWTAIYAGRQTGTLTGVTSQKVFVDAALIAHPSDWYGEGLLLWTGGLNTGARFRVRTDDGAGNLMLYQNPYYLVQVGDTFQIDAGCKHRILEDCTQKFDNTWRCGCFPHLINENALGSAPTG